MDWPNRGRRRGYLRNIFVGADQFVGTLLGIDADETISSYVARCHYNGWQMRMIDWIFLNLFGEQEHCLNSIERKFILP